MAYLNERSDIMRTTAVSALVLFLTFMLIACGENVMTPEYETPAEEVPEEVLLEAKAYEGSTDNIIPAVLEIGDQTYQLPIDTLIESNDSTRFTAGSYKAGYYSETEVLGSINQDLRLSFRLNKTPDLQKIIEEIRELKVYYPKPECRVDKTTIVETPATVTFSVTQAVAENNKITEAGVILPNGARESFGDDGEVTYTLKEDGTRQFSCYAQSEDEDVEESYPISVSVNESLEIIRENTETLIRNDSVLIERTEKILDRQIAPVPVITSKNEDGDPTSTFYKEGATWKLSARNSFTKDDAGIKKFRWSVNGDIRSGKEIEVSIDQKLTTVHLTAIGQNGLTETVSQSAVLQQDSTREIVEEVVTGVIDTTRVYPLPVADLHVKKPVAKKGESVPYEGACKSLAEEHGVHIEDCRLWVTGHGNTSTSGSVSFDTPGVKTFRLTAVDTKGQRSMTGTKDIVVYDPVEKELVNKTFDVKMSGFVSKGANTRTIQWTDDSGVRLLGENEKATSQIHLDWTAYFSGENQEESEHHGLWLQEGEDDYILTRVMNDVDDNIAGSGEHDRPVDISTTLSGGELTAGKRYNVGAYHEKWRYPDRSYPDPASIHFGDGDDSLTITFTVLREK